MRYSKIQGLVHVACAVAAVAALAGCTVRVDRLTDSGELDSEAFLPGEVLKITNPNGSIAIVGSDNAEEVTVSYTKHISLAYYLFEQEKDPAPCFAQMDVDLGTYSTTAGLTVAVTLPGTWARDIILAYVDVEIEMPSEAVLDVAADKGNVVIDGVRGELTVDMAYGNCEITHPLPQPDDIVSCNLEGGNVELSLPSDSSFTIDASTRFGNVDNGGFPLAVDGLIDMSMAGTVGGGGAEIFLRVDAGNIELHRLGSTRRRPIAAGDGPKPFAEEKQEARNRKSRTGCGRHTESTGSTRSTARNTPTSVIACSLLASCSRLLAPAFLPSGLLEDLRGGLKRLDLWTRNALQ